MRLITSKELAQRPDQILRNLGRSGGLVITQSGRPKGILLPTSEDTVLEDVQEQVRARARRAVSAIRRESAQRSLDRLTIDDIDQEIAASRKARKRRQSR